MSGHDIRRFPDAEALADGAAREIARRIEHAHSERGRCRLALAGGSTPRPVYERLARNDLAGRIDWDRTVVFWTDERCVPPDHEQSNYRMINEALLRHLAIPERNVQRIAGELAPDEAARHYAEILGDEPLDVVLLGMGGDGHVASLFPDTPDLDKVGARVVATTSPVPPAGRVSLSLGALCEARSVLFLVSGAAKAERVAQAIMQTCGEAPSLPAAMVRPRDGSVSWFVDEGAAGRL